MNEESSQKVGDYCPIGIFDAGIGGLSALNEIHQLLPDEDLIYIADSAYAPYGDRSAKYVRERSEAITEFLIDQGVKSIVIACNTATAEAATLLRKTLDIPVIGLEPAIKPAVKLSKNGIIGVLATQRTISSDRLLGLTEKYAKNKKVIAQACPGLVEQVEAYDLNSQTTYDLLRKYLQPLLDQHIDTLVLGCTHYPFLLPAIQKITGNTVKIIDTGKPVAEQLQRVLKNNDLERFSNDQQKNSDYKSKLTFYNSSQSKQNLSAMQKLWQSPYHQQPIEILKLPEL